MNCDASPVFLVNSSGDLEPGEVRDAIEEQQRVDWEDHWKPALDKVVERLRESGVDRALWPQSRHWDWRKKSQHFEGSLSNPSFCVVCDGMTQGLMILSTLHEARIGSQQGKPIVYVEYLEVAPWNRRQLGDEAPRYRPIGAILMRTAIEYSKQQDFKGRVGLHSLPQANSWYANACGMKDLGVDADYHNLRYFEMTPEDAEAFIKKGLSP